MQRCICRMKGGDSKERGLLSFHFIYLLKKEKFCREDATFSFFEKEFVNYCANCSHKFNYKKWRV